ncbi:MAG: hypothetical protein JSU83_19870 [Deltaproteobacteria bacterium]|nr:MAG: hypothetical protein JSU83_19870 [Deltaproteobacteria bacterium]
MFLRLNKLGLVILVVGGWLLNVGYVFAVDQKDMGGWEISSPYNKHYDTKELEQFRAWVVKITTVVPMPGMSPGVALHVREGNTPDSEIIVVHVCPTWFMSPNSIGLKPGDRVKIRGAWTAINGEDVFMAAKIKRGNHFVLKVRLTKDGKPFWTMDPKELAAESEAAQPKK